MLVKRIDKNSIPMGLYEAGEDIVKGRAVVLKNGKIMLPASEADVANLLGFATYRIEDVGGGDIADHDVIPAGKKVVVYTLARDNMWGTTEFSGTLQAGDMLTVDYTTNKGKLIKVVGEGKAYFQVFEMSFAGSYPMVEVIVLDPKDNITVVTPLDKSELETALADVEALVEASYTSESWELYETAIITALALPHSTQVEIDAKVLAINTAIALLVEV